MTNLSERVRKAKQLRITKTGRCYHAWGTNGSHYEMCLNSSHKKITTPDGWLKIPVFQTNCKCGDKQCKGNTFNTVCYHSIAAIFRSFEGVDSFASFFETYHDAINGLSFGGYIAKVVNSNGRGHIWCTVRKEKEAQQELTFEIMPAKNLNNLATNLMRGNEDDEGID